MALTNDGMNRALTGAATPARSVPEVGPQSGATLDERVAAMTVDEVADAVDAGEIDRDEAVAAERRGRARAGVLALGDAAGS